MPLAKQLQEALLCGAINAAVTNLELTGDLDEPLCPESLVQVEVAKAISYHGWTKVKMEVHTDTLIGETRWLKPTKPEIDLNHPMHSGYPVGRRGTLDIVGYKNSMPSVLIEVKDEITNTNCDLIKDIKRLNLFLHMKNRLTKKSHIHCCGLLFFISKGAIKRKISKYSEDALRPFLNNTINTAIRNIRCSIPNNTKIRCVQREVIGSAVAKSNQTHEITNKERMCTAVVVILERS